MPNAKKLFWKNWIVLLLGFCVLVLPFLGFPARIDNWLFGILGLGIVITSFLVGRGLSYAASAPDLPPQPPRQTPRKRTPRVEPPFGQPESLTLPQTTPPPAPSMHESFPPLV